jgi:hypothetical protein
VWFQEASEGRSRRHFSGQVAERSSHKPKRLVGFQRPRFISPVASFRGLGEHNIFPKDWLWRIDARDLHLVTPGTYRWQYRDRGVSSSTEEGLGLETKPHQGSSNSAPVQKLAHRILSSCTWQYKIRRDGRDRNQTVSLSLSLGSFAQKVWS